MMLNAHILRHLHDESQSLYCFIELNIFYSALVVFFTLNTDFVFWHNAIEQAF